MMAANMNGTSRKEISAGTMAAAAQPNQEILTPLPAGNRDRRGLEWGQQKERGSYD